MNDGYLTIFADLLAEWGHDPSCSSKTCQGCCLQTTGTLWPESFTAWPASGTASPGGLWRQPTLELHTDGFAGGDLPTLPTPTAGDRGKDAPNRRGSPSLNMLPTLLPTPTAQAAKHGSTRDLKAHGHGYNLWDIPHLISDDTQQQSSDGNN